MKPVAVFRHAPSEGAGHFATALSTRGIALHPVCIDAGDALPRDASAFSGLAFMGGPMSVNDPLPWIVRELELIRDAVRRDVPVLGHCLGAQLMSRALGGDVSRAAVAEIGWGRVTVAENEVARTWFGDTEGFDAFHWHNETFTIPYGATRVVSGVHCANQAFALGRHFGMQFHVEMTPMMVREWCESGRTDIAAASASPAVQPPGEIVRDAETRSIALQRVADRIYARWCEGLARD